MKIDLSKLYSPPFISFVYFSLVNFPKKKKKKLLFLHLFPLLSTNFKLWRSRKLSNFSNNLVRKVVQISDLRWKYGSVSWVTEQIVQQIKSRDTEVDPSSITFISSYSFLKYLLRICYRIFVSRFTLFTKRKIRFADISIRTFNRRESSTNPIFFENKTNNTNNNFEFFALDIDHSNYPYLSNRQVWNRYKTM